MPDDSRFPLNDPATVLRLTALLADALTALDGLRDPQGCSGEGPTDCEFHGHQHPTLPCPYGQITPLIEAAAQLGVHPHTA